MEYCKICGFTSPYHGLGCANDPAKTFEENGVFKLLPSLTEEENKLELEATENWLSKIKLPPSWKDNSYPPRHPLYGMRVFSKGGLKVIIGVSPNLEKGKTWIHASCSRHKRLPTYEDMVEMKSVFIGPDLQALQIFPAKKNHININPFVLHLWACIEGDNLPEFGKSGTI